MPPPPPASLDSTSSSRNGRKRPHPTTTTAVGKATVAGAAEEFLLGGLSTAFAVIFSNPFDVTKTRMQLQGELKAKGTYQLHYRNLFHAAWTIARNEGVLALQKGLGPALIYQFVMNGVRLGTFQTLVNAGFTRPKPKGGHSPTKPQSQHPEKDRSDFMRNVLAGALGGGLGGVVASPLYLVKTHLQSMSRKEIAVGHQYSHRGMAHALRDIYRSHGVRGLWRGVEGAVPRLTLGSALQLSTFAFIKDRVHQSGYVSEAWVPVAASLISSVNIVVFMEPLDVVRTRLYNQPVDAAGRGLYYRGFLDCFRKIAEAEGMYGFYKGAWAAYFRMAPQAILGLSFWDTFRRLYLRRQQEQQQLQQEEGMEEKERG